MNPIFDYVNLRFSSAKLILRRWRKHFISDFKKNKKTFEYIIFVHSIIPSFLPDINQPSLPTSFYSVLVSFSVSIALSTVFLSMNSPDNSPFSSVSRCGLAVRR